MNSIQLNSVILMCVSTLLLGACDKKEPEVEQSKVVMVTQPASSSLQQQSFAGEVSARQQTTLAFRVGGQITDRFVDVGDRVRVGQVLAKLDVQDANLQLNAARAQLEQAQAAYKNAEVEYLRFKQLLPEHAVSRSQFDAIENQHKAAVSSLKQAQANFDVTQNQTRYNQLVANKNGVITQRNIEIGQVVAAGQPVYQIAIDGDREVVIGVPEQMIGQIHTGQKVLVSLWSAPNNRYAAVVREVSPAADQSRTFTVKVALQDRQAPIQLGQSAKVFLNIQQNNTINVPLSSVSAIENKPYVLVVDVNNQLKRVWVTVGEYKRDHVSITQGLNPNDWIVVGGVHLLRQGQKISPVDHDNRPVQVNKQHHSQS